ncbi:MAG TPA: F0F1 ATP synthase subunit delta [Verrucomicrobiota bacterium]|nr:H(+)-transporting ATPase [Verrucomicrobiales bacterium]HRI13099.1 F0F1 ATP synthase subunit delta [Verrucomicrobiota bacterium]
MKISKQARREGKDLFNACRVGGVLDEAKVRQAVTQVLRAKPRGYLNIVEHFKRLVKLDLDRRAARVENAVETTPAQMSDIRANLERKYGPGLDLTFWVNPALIGGLKIKVGSDIYDGSISGRLAELRDLA